MKNRIGGTRVEKIAASNLKIDLRELAARLGGVECDIPTNVYNSVLECAACGYSLRLTNATVCIDFVQIGDERICSRDLARAMDGCNAVLLLCASLGFSVDRYISTLGARSTAEQFFADALADALVEGLCDLAEEDAKESLALTNRFSPGYGDLDLSYGRYIVTLLGADRSLGIRYTESGLALPKKTVTAFIGVRGMKQ